MKKTVQMLIVLASAAALTAISGCSAIGSAPTLPSETIPDTISASSLKLPKPPLKKPPAASLMKPPEQYLQVLCPNSQVVL